MNFELSAKDFIALVKCAASVSGKSTVPIVEHALFSADGKMLSVSATNLEQTATASVPCDASGAFIASVSRLSAIAGTLDKSNPVKIAFKPSDKAIHVPDEAVGTVTISQGRSVHRVPTLRATDFPVALTQPLEDATIEWEAPAPILERSLGDLSQFAGDEKTQPYIAGIFFDPEACALVATNAYALARDAADWCRSKRAGFTLPSKAVKPIRDLLSNTDRVQITANDRAAVFSVEGARLRTSLLDTQFPQYQRLIPEKYPTKFRVNHGALTSSLNRVRAVGSDPVGGTGIVIEFGKDEIRLEANGDGGNQGVDYCACELLKGAPLTIGAPMRQLNPALDTMDDAGDLDIAVRDAASPIIITPAGSDDFLRIVMPVQLNKVRVA